ncbi:hypothetical protein TIFTF001_000457 [Ficus carica]|uniref:Uncharacterized protein n=1 Tax=Ficus carica TaxID=3494 RepID=A0AA87YV01_FICCA|nr:hypothetical protein TIFTF001_000457 [Ficus carica]
MKGRFCYGKEIRDWLTVPFRFAVAPPTLHCIVCFSLSLYSVFSLSLSLETGARTSPGLHRSRALIEVRNKRESSSAILAFLEMVENFNKVLSSEKALGESVFVVLNSVFGEG